jgi:hypothetical protein
MNELGGIVFVAADVAEALIIFGISAPRSAVVDGFIIGNATEDGRISGFEFSRRSLFLLRHGFENQNPVFISGAVVSRCRETLQR